MWYEAILKKSFPDLSLLFVSAAAGQFTQTQTVICKIFEKCIYKQTLGFSQKI